MTTTPKKTSQQQTVTAFSANDYFVIVHDLSGIPATGKFQFGAFFANLATPVTITSNTNVAGVNSIFSATTVSSANIVSTDSHTPASSSDVVNMGKIWFDANYLYVATANNTIKRVALSSF